MEKSGMLNKNVGIFYTLIAREKQILVEHTLIQKSFTFIGRMFLDKLTPNEKRNSFTEKNSE